MSYNSRVNIHSYLHGYCSSCIYYFIICFSLLSLSPLSCFISSLVHWSHLRPLISLISFTIDTISTGKPWCTRPRNDAVAKLSGTWCVGLAEVIVNGYWLGVLIRLMVGFDGYWSVGWWWVLHPLMWRRNERWSNERWWFWRVCSIWSLMVACGWVWVILGLCWVCSLTKKTVARRRRW